MARAYRPHNNTRALVRRIKALDGIAEVRIIAPHHGLTVTPARLLVVLERGNSPEPARTIFTFAEAREWLAHEEASA